MNVKDLQNVVFAERVVLDYTNHKGVYSRRAVIPVMLWRGTSSFHEGEQDFLTAYDMGKEDIRDFAVRDIQAWEPAMRSHLPHMMEAKRASGWPKVRKSHLEIEPACRACGGVKSLEVHHKLPFHLHPELELEQANLITLCEAPSHNCHLLTGHCLSWQFYNPNVVVDAAYVLSMIQGRKDA